MGFLPTDFVIQGEDRKWMANIGRTSRPLVEVQDRDKVFVKGDCKHCAINVSVMQRVFKMFIRRGSEKTQGHH